MLERIKIWNNILGTIGLFLVFSSSIFQLIRQEQLYTGMLWVGRFMLMSAIGITLTLMLIRYLIKRILVKGH